ncbi:MAG: hypothetical protein RBR87_15795 [Bacteroidales bacterium]|jgi:hypothetical protein|nr:hypothetical protein [Bacteroidales bacterium]
MDKIQLKSGIHAFIDQIDNIELLKDYYNELKGLIKDKKILMWDSLSEGQKREVLLSYDESEQDENLIDNDEVMKKYEKWS